MTSFFHRRAFLRHSALGVAGLAGRSLLAAESGEQPEFRIGLLTDLHSADKPANINRYYRETAGKLREAVNRFNQEDLAFIVQLGDLIDKADTVAQEIEWLRSIDAIY